MTIVNRNVMMRVSMGEYFEKLINLFKKEKVMSEDQKKLATFKKIVSFLRGSNVFFAEANNSEKTSRREEAMELQDLFANTNKIEEADSLIFFCGCGCHCDGQGKYYREDLDRFLLPNIKKILIVSTVQIATIKKDQFNKDIHFLWVNICDGWVVDSFEITTEQIQKELVI
ncbi:MAG: hypothetical protein V1698_01910 [bacterium]